MVDGVATPADPLCKCEASKTMSDVTAQKGRILSRLRFVIAAVAVSVAAVLPAPAEEYLLGPQDHLRVKVHKWRPAEGEVDQWATLNDIFIVGAEGTLSLPFVGTVKAEGTGVEDVRAAIAERLAANFGLHNPPDVAVEVIRYRPFYIIGRVRQPGEYEYRPGLTAVQAIGIAGGLSPVDAVAESGDREIISRSGEIDLLTLGEIELVARKARLLAEQDEREKIDFPKSITDLSNAPETAAIMEQEGKIFRARRDAVATQLQALDNLARFLEAEVVSLEKQIGLLDRRIESIEVDLSSIGQLVQRGLAVSSRESTLERQLLLAQSDRLTAETSLLRARQELGRVQLTIVERSTDRIDEVAVALRETEAELSKIRMKRQTNSLLLSALGAASFTSMQNPNDEDYPAPRITIIRHVDADNVEIEASGSTRIRPGDTISVDIVLDSDREPTSAGAPNVGQ